MSILDADYRHALRQRLDDIRLISIVSAILLLLMPVNFALDAEAQQGLAKPTQLANGSDIVVFNVSNLKFHSPSCIWACRCTKHCINITRAEAHQRGGVPCKVCNGGE